MVNDNSTKGSEFRDYVERLEKERLKVIRDYQDEMADALETAADVAPRDEDKMKAEVAARAMRASAEEFRKYIDRLEDGRE